MGETPPTSMVLGDAAGVTLAGKIMVGTIVTLFFVVVVILGIHIYARLYLWRRNGGAGRRRFVLEDGMVVGNEGLRRGVEPEVLKSMPVVVYSSVEFKDGLECAVCLAEVLDGEKARVLPNCKHGFHVGCIDTWLQSHSTCPLCRNPIGVKESEQVVSTENNAAPADGAVNFPTNVLFWGNDVHVSSRVVSSEEGTSGRLNESLVIDIPRNNICDTCSSSLGVRAGDQDELKSPLSGRLRSLTRLWSMNKRVAPSSSASTNFEQAEDERV